MLRTATQVLDHHIEAMMGMDLDNILSDYSEGLIAITCLDGRARTMGYDTISSLIPKGERLARMLGLKVETTIDKLHVLCRQGVGNYAVYLAEMKPFSSFASFTYIIENNKAIYVTGFAKAPFWMPSLGVDAHPFAPGDETMAVIEKHLAHVRARDTAAMCADYADDAVILTNLAESPFMSRDGINAFCAGLVEKGYTHIEALTGNKSKYKVCQAVAELGCVAFRNLAMLPTVLPVVLAKKIAPLEFRFVSEWRRQNCCSEFKKHITSLFDEWRKKYMAFLHLLSTLCKPLSLRWALASPCGV